MDRFDRQRQVFGDQGQERLSSATVGVVGGGGLGSFVVLELAYLGVGRIVIVDDDVLEQSNRNRLVGAWESHPAGVPKVAVLRDLALLIDSGLMVETVRGRLDSEEAKTSLANVDVVVGCVDHDGSRFALNEFCCQHGLTLIDCGSDTFPEEGGVVFGGRVCVATRETGCLACFRVLDQREVNEQLESPEQRADRDTIYGVDRGDLNGGPAVVTVNGVIASIAATEVMVLLIGIRAPIAHQEWRGHRGNLRRVEDGVDGCYYCGLRPAKAK